jgi:hypothetical protein
MNSATAQVTTRTKAVQVVSTIADETGEPSSHIWHRDYSRQQLLYGTNLASHPRQGGESLLSVAERFGYIEETYSIVLAEWLFSQTNQA